MTYLEDLASDHRALHKQLTAQAKQLESLSQALAEAREERDKNKQPDPKPTAPAFHVGDEVRIVNDPVDERGEPYSLTMKGALVYSFRGKRAKITALHTNTDPPWARVRCCGGDYELNLWLHNLEPVVKRVDRFAVGDRVEIINESLAGRVGTVWDAVSRGYGANDYGIRLFHDEDKECFRHISSLRIISEDSYWEKARAYLSKLSAEVKAKLRVGDLVRIVPQALWKNGSHDGSYERCHGKIGVVTELWHEIASIKVPGGTDITQPSGWRNIAIYYFNLTLIPK